MKNRQPRTPLSTLVQFRFNSIEEFLSEYSVDLSPSGIFIRSDHLPELGTAVYLQFTLSDGSRLIEGLGRVARVADPSQGAKVSGFAVAFVDFDEESLAAVRKLCAGKAPAGPVAEPPQES